MKYNPSDLSFNGKEEEEEGEDEDSNLEHSSPRSGIVATTFRKLLLSIKSNILKPFFIGASAAFGISCGYTLYDFISEHAKHWTPFLLFTRPLSYIKGTVLSLN